MLLAGMNSEEKQRVYEWLEPVMPEHLGRGLVILLCHEGRNIPSGYSWKTRFKFPSALAGDRPYGCLVDDQTGAYVQGMHWYLPEEDTSRIYLTPYCWNQHTLLHEVGHRVTLYETGQLYTMTGCAMDRWTQDFGLSTITCDQLYTFSGVWGLSPGAFISAREFLAEAYVLDLLGDYVQRATLEQFWRKINQRARDAGYDIPRLHDLFRIHSGSL